MILEDMVVETVVVVEVKQLVVLAMLAGLEESQVVEEVVAPVGQRVQRVQQEEKVK